MNGVILVKYVLPMLGVLSGLWLLYKFWFYMILPRQIKELQKFKKTSAKYDKELKKD